MIKTFTYKGIEIKIKTNHTKAGVAYFGEQDINSVLEGIYNKINYKHGQGYIDESFVVEMFNDLKVYGIAPFEVSKGSISYRGTKMSDVLEKEPITKEVPIIKEITKEEVPTKGTETTEEEIAKAPQSVDHTQLR